jgi:hypothetical protein
LEDSKNATICFEEQQAIEQVRQQVSCFTLESFRDFEQPFERQTTLTHD